MRFLYSIIFSVVFFSTSVYFSAPVTAQLNSQLNSPTGYYPYAIARPEDRVWIRSLPIEQRPSRPLHFYGNRVRQAYTVGPIDRNVLTSRPTRSIGLPLFDPRRR